MPGISEPVRELRTLLDFSHAYGYPVMMKRTDGGGGRGITVVHDDDEMRRFYMNHDAMQGGDLDEYFIEKFIDKARHVETQCGRDRFGDFTVYSTRDCSVQRRNQKLVEEAPAPFLPDEVIIQLETYSRSLFNKVDYIGLGTCEFMVTPHRKVYFLEVNPRLQVEHTVSEEVCGLDLVREQIDIADGGHLTPAPAPRGHSFELRITSEDPATNLTPSSGTLERIVWPSGPGLRIDTGVEQGDTVSPKFDSMMGKLVVTASDRAAAVARVRRALEELKVEGVPTPASLFEQIFNDDEFTAEHGVAYDVSTKWLERKYLNKEASSTKGGQPASMAGASGAKEAEQKESSETFVIEVNNHRVSLTVPNDIVANLTGGAKARDAKRAIQPLRGQGLHHVEKKQQGNDGQSGVIASPMQAVVTRINVAEGQDVAKGDLLEGDFDFEERPRILIAGAYSYNHKASRLKGQRGGIMPDDATRNIGSYFPDFILKYRGFAFYTDYMGRTCDEPLFDSDRNAFVYSGQGLNMQASYLFRNKWEVALRNSTLFPEEKVQPLAGYRNWNQPTLGVTRYIIGHSLKVQADMSYNTRSRSADPNYNRWEIRFQLELGL